MYVNNRDQINYHGFLTALRTMHGYLLKQVSTGVCCDSGMNRFEKGNRVAEKLVRDRLTARLGVSCEKYEDYLQPKEYIRWEQRLRIVKAIEKRELKTAKRELSEYEKFLNLNRTNQQFVEAMRFMILVLEGVSEEQLRDCIKKAVQLTVPNIEKAFEGEHLLSDQEVNLILEQMCMEVPKKVIRDEEKWRISEYEKLISYMDNSCWEKLQKAKVYPKVTCYICKQLLSKEITEKEIRRGLELCHNAIELLRDTSRLYYFIELTETRRTLATRLMEFEIDAEERTQLEEMLKENNQWENVFKDLYAEYKVAPYMSDFCYLYYENECHNMVEVIETRRKMLGLSRVKLGEGICTEKTIVRFERQGVNPSIELVRRLFDKMGLCAEYRRARVVTTDVNALMLSNEVTRNMNDYDFENWEKNLLKLESELHMNIPHNRQELKRLETVLKYEKHVINKEELFREIKDALEYTLPIKALKKDGNIHLSRNEVTCVFDFAFKTQEEVSECCFNIIKEICDEILDENEVSMQLLYKYELMTDAMESYLGNNGMFEKSNLMSIFMLKECLTYRRSEVLADNLYNLLWNYQNENKDEILDKVLIENYLNKCLRISTLLKSSKRTAFFQNKISQIQFV